MRIFAIVIDQTALDMFCITPLIVRICEYLIQSSTFLLGTSWNKEVLKQINVCNTISEGQSKHNIMSQILHELLNIIADIENELRTCIFYVVVNN